MYKLLIVEDDKVLKFGLKKCLEEEGYSVVVSENLSEIFWFKSQELYANSIGYLQTVPYYIMDFV